MNKTLRISLIIMLSAVLLFSLSRVALIQRGYGQTDKLYTKLRAAYVQIEEPSLSVQDDRETEGEEYFPAAQIDLEALRGINPEVIGWLWIPDTEISYPLLKGEDNQTYLSRSYNREYDAAGSLFMDYRNADDISDDNTIIYGHNMKNGAMFGGLKRFAALDYIQAHPYAYVFTEESVLKYRIFAGFKTESTSKSYTMDTSGKMEELLAYIASCAGTALTALPDAQDSLLTLSTCTTGSSTERFVVHAALVAAGGQGDASPT